MRETNSSSMSSTVSTSTVPSVDISSESWRTSSSSSRPQILPPYCSPSASIRIAARFGPATASTLAPWRLPARWPSVEITLVMSFELAFCRLPAMSGHFSNHFAGSVSH